MAVIPGTPGLSAVVRVDKVPLQEHSVPPDANDDSEKKVTKYIQAQPGAMFDIKLQVTGQYQYQNSDLKVRYTIDGQKVDYVTFNKKRFEKLKPKKSMFHICDGSVTGKGDKWRKRAFRFSELVSGR
jgi:hypothetical protein